MTGNYVAQDQSTGTMSGTIKGNTFAFRWKQGEYEGPGSFEISGNSMDGQYSTDVYPADMNPYYLTGTWHADRQ